MSSIGQIKAMRNFMQTLHRLGIASFKDTYEASIIYYASAEYYVNSMHSGLD